MKINCLFDELLDIGKIFPHPKNFNKHPENQIERLAKILDYQGWRYPIKISKRSGFITSGHGRLSAAIKNKWEKVPVNYQDYESEEQEIADLASDNAIAGWSDLDLALINSEMINLGPDFDVDLLGIEDFKIDLSENESKISEELYSEKIEVPIYMPTGKKPRIDELLDDSKTIELLTKIDQSSISEPLKTFLRKAAQRFTVINFQNVAEFYAHESKEVQDLFEDNVLVIIDYEKALEKGLIELTEEIADE